MRQRITIYDPPIGADDYGQDVSAKISMDGWTVNCTRWAKVESSAGSQYIQNDTIRALTSHVITMRYLPTLDAAQRIMIGSRILNVVSFADTEERHIQHVVNAQEVNIA